MPTTVERLTQIRDQIDAAAAAVEADDGASPVLGAVVRELARKADKSLDSLPDADDAALRLSIVEVEQAADSAKAAVEADAGPSDATRQAVLDADLAICILKGKTACRGARLRSLVQRGEDEHPRGEPVLAPGIGSDEAAVRAPAHTVGDPLGERVDVRLGPTAVHLEPGVRIANGLGARDRHRDIMAGRSTTTPPDRRSLRSTRRNPGRARRRGHSVT